MTAVRHGFATTASGSRYPQQLCKHWSHKFEVEFEAMRGEIRLPPGRVLLLARPDRLEAALTPVGDAEADRLQGVFEDHINRFAFREAPLAFDRRDRETEPAA